PCTSPLQIWRSSCRARINGCRHNRWKAYSGSRCSSSTIRLPGDHDGSAGTAHLRQIAGGGHSNPEAAALFANHRTIVVGLHQCALQTPSPRTPAMAGIPELAGLARLWKYASLLKRFCVQNLESQREQVWQRLSGAGPINTRLRGGARRNPHGADATSSLQWRQTGHRSHQGLTNRDHIGPLEKFTESL